MAAERLAGPQRRLEVDLGASDEPAERRARERLGDRVEGDPPIDDVGRREADPVDGDRVAERRAARGRRRLDQEPHAVGAPLDRRDAAPLPHDAREHGAKASPS